MQDEGVISPVIALKCDFKTPTSFADEILIETSMKSYSGVKFVFEYVMKNKNTGDIVAVGETEHCFVNQDGKPIIIKKQFPKMHEYFVEIIEK